MQKGMSEREFIGWQIYSNKYRLPQRRLEVYLANICFWLARTNLTDIDDLSIDDFLICDHPEEPEIIDTLEATKEAMNFKPRNVKEA